MDRYERLLLAPASSAISAPGIPRAVEGPPDHRAEATARHDCEAMQSAVVDPMARQVIGTPAPQHHRRRQVAICGPRRYP